MSIEEYRALIEPFLSSKNAEHECKTGKPYGVQTLREYRGAIKESIKKLEEWHIESYTAEFFSEFKKYLSGKHEKSPNRATTKYNITEEFDRYVKGERKASMIDENENEVAGNAGAITETECEATQNEVTTDISLSQESEPPTAENEAVQNDSDMAMNQETETPEPVQSEANVENEPERMNESAQNEPVQAETPKALGRPRKAAGDKRANSFSVYLNAENASALKDLAAYERKEVSVFLAEIIEKFISRNEQALMDYRMFQKNKIPLQ